MVPPNHGLACTQTSDAGPPEAIVTVPLMLPPVASAGTAGAGSTTPAAGGGAAAPPPPRRPLPPPPRPSRRMLPPRQRNDPAPLGMRRVAACRQSLRRSAAFVLLCAEGRRS